jgi:hypothetical protein
VMTATLPLSEKISVPMIGLLAQMSDCILPAYPEQSLLLV